MRTTTLACMAMFLFCTQALANEKNQTVTVNLPENQSMEKIVQDVSGYLAMQGSSVKLDRTGKHLDGMRVDGIRFEVLFKSDTGHALVQCRDDVKPNQFLPSQKHKMNGRRFNKSKSKDLERCTQALSLAVQRAVK